MFRLGRIALFTFLLGGAAVWLNSCREEDESQVAVPLGLDPNLMKSITRLGPGYLVWERKSKLGIWEIWTKRLSGGKEKRLVPKQKGKDHFCPQVSPDGSTLAFMSYNRGDTPYPSDAGKTGALWLMDMSTRKRREIVAEARSYAEDRAVTWLDSQRLCYIDAQGYTMEINLQTNATRRLIKMPQEKFGYLVSPDMKHATTGTPEFAVYDAVEETVHPRQRMGGCQPYFTNDGVWGYAMGGAGGPVNKIRLATREISTILTKNDARLNGKRNYIYFPMISSCQRLLAFAASPDDHDHFNANYDIYVARLDPAKLDVIGAPVRYTAYKGVDRYPDVFRKELPLGTQFVEGETAITFKPEAPGEWRWHITGGVNKVGRELTQTFTKPGEYWVEARLAEDTKVHGYVHVNPATPPQIEGVRLGGKDLLVVSFDELVAGTQASVTLPKTGQPLAWKLADNQLELEISLPPGITQKDQIQIEGFVDTAQKPNRMKSATVSLPATQWPASDGGLVFVWEGFKGRTKLPNGTPCTVKPEGLAYWDEHGVMKFRGGWFDAPDAGELVSSECRKSHEFSLEFVVTPQQQPGSAEPQRIFTIANTATDQNVTLNQNGTNLELWMRTPGEKSSTEGVATQVARVENNRPLHVLLTYGKDRLTVYLDGSQSWVRSRLQGDFSNWEDMHMRFGATADGTQPWRGLIERVAIYNRTLDDAEVNQHANASIVAISKREAPESWKVTAKLMEASATPALQEFQPYTEALVRHLYEVVKTEEGTPLDGKTIMVTHWSWLGAQPMPSQNLKAGDIVELTLHRASAQPELANLFVKDEIISGFDAESYHDARDWDVPQKTP